MNTFFTSPTHSYVLHPRGIFKNKLFGDALPFCQIRSLYFCSLPVWKSCQMYFPSPQYLISCRLRNPPLNYFGHDRDIGFPQKFISTYHHSYHICHSTLILFTKYLKKNSGNILNLNLQVGTRDEWIFYVWIFWLSPAAAVCQVVLACFVNFSQKAAAKKVTNNRVYLPTPQR